MKSSPLSLKSQNRSFWAFILLALMLAGISIVHKSQADLPTPEKLSPEAANSKFALGIGAFQKGEYAQSIEFFREVAKIQPRNEYAYYNWGLAESKMENLGWATALFRKALFLAPDFKEAKRALDSVTEKLPSSSALEANIGLESFRTQVLKRWDWNLGFFILIASFLLSSVVWIRYAAKLKKAYAENLPSPKFPIVAVLGSLIFLFMLVSLTLKSLELTETEATLVVKTSALKSGPGEDSTTLLEVLEGQSLSVRRIQSDWLQVQLPGGIVGWIISKDVFITTEAN